MQFSTGSPEKRQPLSEFKLKAKIQAAKSES